MYDARTRRDRETESSATTTARGEGAPAATPEAALLETAIHQATETVVITDPTGSIEYVNPAFTATTGWTRGEALGQNPRILKSGLHEPAFYRQFWDAIVAGEVWRGDVVNRRKDGTFYDAQLTVTPVRDRDGRIAHFIAIQLDVTARRRAERELLAAKAQLEAANGELERALATSRELVAAAEAAAATKAQFLARMSHDLRTPLNGIVGLASLLVDSPLTTEQREFVRYIVQSGDELTEAVSTILDRAQMGAPKVPELSSWVDVGDVLGAVSAEWEPIARQNHLAFSVEIDPAIPKPLRGDPERLRWVLVTLVSNAIRFTTRGRVAVNAALDGQSADHAVIRIAVHDTGIGIPLEARAGLFQPCWRNGDIAPVEIDSVGLGLSLSRALVERMHGALDFESEVGCGSTFWFTVRLDRQQAAQGTA